MTVCESTRNYLAKRVSGTFGLLGSINFIEKYSLKRHRQLGKSCFQGWLSDAFPLNVKMLMESDFNVSLSIFYFSFKN